MLKVLGEKLSDICGVEATYLLPRCGFHADSGLLTVFPGSWNRVQLSEHLGAATAARGYQETLPSVPEKLSENEVKSIEHLRACAHRRTETC
jgi:hypothetical protein